MKKNLLTLTLCAAVIAQAHDHSDAKTDAKTLTVEIQLLDGGKAAGKVIVSESNYGLVFTPALHGLTPGLHGFHIHEHPSCDAGEKDGKTVLGLAAGGHWDPKKNRPPRPAVGRRHPPRQPAGAVCGRRRQRQRAGTRAAAEIARRNQRAFAHHPRGRRQLRRTPRAARRWWRPPRLRHHSVTAHEKPRRSGVFFLQRRQQLPCRRNVQAYQINSFIAATTAPTTTAKKDAPVTKG